MATVRRLALVWILMAGLTDVVAAQAWRGPGAIGVKVSDQRGKAVVGAEVVLRLRGRLGAGEGPPVALTDAKGELAVPNIAEGIWELEIQHPEFMSFFAVVRIEEGGKAEALEASHHATSGGGGPLRIKFVKAKADPNLRYAPRPLEVARPVEEPRRRPEPSRPAPTPTVEVRPAESPVLPPGPTPTLAPTPAPLETATTAPAAAPSPPAASESSPAPGEAAEPAPRPAATPAPVEVAPPLPPAPAIQQPPPTAPTPVETAAPAPPAPVTPVRASPAPSPSRVESSPAAPAPRARRLVPMEVSIRTSNDGTCFDCKPGEAAVTAELLAAPRGQGSGCTAPGREVLAGVLRRVAGAGESLARGGSLLDGESRAPRDLPADLAAELSAALQPFLGSCAVAVAVIPRDGRYTGYAYGARDESSVGGCLSTQECQIGASRWFGDPVVERGEVTVVYGFFENAAAAERLASLTVYFRPATSRGGR